MNLTNHFLIAMPAMDDPYFSRSLIYIAEHNDQGALGLIVNRPIELNLAALFEKIDVPLEAPEHAIGRDTEECIKVGAVTGAAAMAEGLVARMKRELGREDATVIATGGLASIVADSTDAFDVVDGQLTIKGICEIYRRMQELG